MSEFKSGDEVFYLEVICPFTYNGVQPDYLTIKKFTVIDPIYTKFINVKHDDWDKPILIDEMMIFKSKQDCIDAFKKRLDEL